MLKLRGRLKDAIADKKWRAILGQKEVIFNTLKDNMNAFSIRTFEKIIFLFLEYNLGIAYEWACEVGVQYKEQGRFEEFTVLALHVLSPTIYHTIPSNGNMFVDEVARDVLERQLFSPKNILDQFALMSKVFTENVSNDRIIELVENFNEKGNEPLLSRAVHERYYEGLLDRGLLDNFYIQCTCHVGSQIQILEAYPFQEALEEIMQRGFPHFQRFLDAQMQRASISPPYQACIHSTSASLTIINIIYNCPFLPLMLNDSIESKLAEASQMLERNLQQLALKKTKITDAGARVSLDDPNKGGLQVQGSVIGNRESEIQVKLDGGEPIWVGQTSVQNITPTAFEQAASVLDLLKRLQTAQKQLSHNFPEATEEFSAMLRKFSKVGSKSI